ncbi:TPA: GNAT family N-acetyltransferase [Staphylococcus pseudintermedius]|uniref:GNAT family N-acetyltransferase n=1 Tax=Staphylococcus pseudintermedius TaxID=283734 RepID=UPI000C1C09BB|nr:GNAT family N-acetyltransferase [Staphylococcus pseudintermedius]EGQ0387158.1 GNAT family N-acetyltransferase [Staphylococcus pseudintermedius]EGQ1310229.1 GNAT family N-acetyltransferase [Staphylococcus pseudintermedius]EGQ1591746.1 GNAT family N-acetyltransferase [Staphylococcus pseudintermedius]EGQ1594957.1 GNAT family N-acetyltransferase [Staphylococcus pseudintermedius]EGQ2740066.1 GNAT family N-acetyltransferase [Staphylococcus pseudintermedius]
MIKILTHNDLNQFKQLINDAQLIETNPNHYEVELTPEDIAALFHPDNQARTVLLGAFDADALVGFIQLNYNSQLTKRHKAVIEHLYVVPQYRSEGVAQQLLEALIPHAKENGIENIFISVASNNIAAKIFYDNFGFEFLALEENARKINGHYIEDHWLIYYT